MTATPIIDPEQVPARTAGAGEPGSAARAAADVRQRVAVGAGRQRVWRRVRRPRPGARDPAQRVPAPRPAHPGGHPRCRGAQAAGGLVLPGLAPDPAAPVGGGAERRSGDLLPARGQHPADGQAGAHPGDHRAVQVAGERDGQGPRRAGRAVPHPPADRGPVHLRRCRCVDDEGPRGRPGGQGRGHGRHRRQRRRLPRGPRDPHGHNRVRRRLVVVLPRPGRPLPDRGRAGHLRRAYRWSTPSAPPCRPRPGSGAAPTTRPT